MSPDLYERDPFSVLTSAASVIFAIGAELTRSKDLSQIFLAFALILAKFLLKNVVDCGGFGRAEAVRHGRELPVAEVEL